MPPSPLGQACCESRGFPPHPTAPCFRQGLRFLDPTLPFPPAQAGLSFPVHSSCFLGDLSEEGIGTHTGTVQSSFCPTPLPVGWEAAFRSHSPFGPHK